MDSTPGPSSHSQNVATNADALLALTDFSDASLECLNYVNVPISRPLTGPLHINQLNEYCFLTLLDQFPLQQQLPFRAVCKQWNARIKLKCLRKRSLKLFENTSQIVSLNGYCSRILYCKLYEDDRFKLKPTGPTDDELIGTFEQLQGCAHLFANVEHFVYFGYSGKDKLNELPAMFPKLTSLTTLSLPPSIALSNAINSLQHLTSLHLFESFFALPKEMMPILKQLEDFSICCSREYSIVQSAFPLLSKLGPNLKSLMFSAVCLSSDELTRSLTLNPALVNITTLTLGRLLLCDQVPLLKLICSKFTNLTYLDLKFPIHFVSLKDLSNLNHLTELHLDSIDDVPAQILLNLVPVKSVKKLHINIRNLPPLISRYLQLIFPVVEEIVFNWWHPTVHVHMAEYSYSCSVRYHNPHDAVIMGRHRVLSNYEGVVEILFSDDAPATGYDFSDSDGDIFEH